VIAPTKAESTLATVVGYVSDWFGWYYVALATAILVFVLFLAFSRYGRVRLGPEHSRPEFSTLAWASMLFAAGIGTDLMFFAVNEPVVQYLTPPSGQGETVEAAREATAWTLFHYGISGWGMYALMGMALGYFAYRMNLPLAVRSALYPLIGKRINGPIGHTVDIAAVLGTSSSVCPKGSPPSWRCSPSRSRWPPSPRSAASSGVSSGSPSSTCCSPSAWRCGSW
jgi:choline/glycine/proline betaine transport protein